MQKASFTFERSFPCSQQLYLKFNNVMSDLTEGCLVIVCNNAFLCEGVVCTNNNKKSRCCMISCTMVTLTGSLTLSYVNL